MKKIIAIVCLASFLCSGCTKIILAMYGYHSPREESIQSYKMYCAKLNLDSQNIIFLRDSTMFMKYYAKADTQLKVLNIGVPEIYVFDNKGILLKYKPDSACNAPGFQFTERACEKLSELKKTNLKITDFLKYFTTSEGNNVNANPEQFDATVIISWAKFTGRLNKDHVKIWEDNLRRYSNCKLKIYKASLDPVKGMNLDLTTKINQ